MRKWLCVASVLLLAGCSKTKNPWPTAQGEAGANPATESAPLGSRTQVAATESAPLGSRTQVAATESAPLGSRTQVAATESAPLGSRTQVAATESAPRRSAGVIPSGTPVHVRVDESIDTRRNRGGDPFTATLSQPIEVDGRIMVPAGTEFSGHVTTAAASGRLRGRASLGLRLDSFRLNGRVYPVQTSSVQRVSASHKKRNALLIGGGAGLGAALGAIAGGGKGALIGAGAGAGAGTAGAAATGKRQVAIGAETPLRFTLRSSVEM